MNVLGSKSDNYWVKNGKIQEKKGIPLLGENFPEMKVQTSNDLIELPKAFSGKWLILFSHIGDFTLVFTTEFVAFQQRYEKFKGLNCELIGLNVDQVFSHVKWMECVRKVRSRNSVSDNCRYRGSR